MSHYAEWREEDDLVACDECGLLKHPIDLDDDLVCEDCLDELEPWVTDDPGFDPKFLW